MPPILEHDMTKEAVLLDVNPTVTELGNNPSLTHLMIACVNNSIKDVQQTLIYSHKEIDFDCTDVAGRTAFHHAVNGGSIEIVKMLYEKSEELIRLIIQHATTNFGDTALHLASRKGYFEICEFLILHGAKCNPQNEKLETPLHLAAASGHDNLYQLLIEHGANQTIKNQEDQTPQDLWFLWIWPNKSADAKRKL